MNGNQTYTVVNGRPPLQGQKVDIASGFSVGQYNHVDVTYPTSSTEQYVFKNSGITVGTLTLTYSDSTKNSLTTVDYVKS